MDGDTSSAIKYGVVAAILAGGVIVANRVFETKHHPQANVEEASPAPVAATAAPTTPAPPPADASAAAPATPAPAPAPAEASAAPATPASPPAEASAAAATPAPAEASAASSAPAESTDTASAPAAESAPAHAAKKKKSAPAPAASEAAAEPSAPAPEPTASAAPASHEISGGTDHSLWWNPKHKGFGVSTVGPTNSGASKGVAVVFSSELADPSAAAKQLVLTHHGAAVTGDWHASGNAKTLVLEGLDAGRYELKIDKTIKGADGKSLGGNLHGSVDVW